MSKRWVLSGLLKLSAAFIEFDPELQQPHQIDQQFFHGVPASPVQLRWLVDPKIGLSRHPFQVWRQAVPAGGDLQTWANGGGWDLVETVGLPVDFNDPPWTAIYDSEKQGVIPQAGTPIEAAKRRLLAGAPRLGWAPLTVGGFALPPWEPPDLDRYLDELIQSRLWSGLRDMLTQHPNPLEQVDFLDKEDDAQGVSNRLSPRLVGVAGGAASNRPAQTEWRPLELLTLSVSSDPFASLALGYGTALEGQTGEAYMVTVVYDVNFLGQDMRFELADIVVIGDRNLPGPLAPGGLAADLLSHNRPAQIDGPALESIRLSWERPQRPENFLDNPPVNTFPAGYAVWRLGPRNGPGQILLEARRSGGWVPFVAGRPQQDRSVNFIDHVVRETDSGGQVVAQPRPVDLSYAVAAQDLFGRWGTWETAALTLEAELPQVPGIMAARLDASGALSVDFTWDWSARSPEFIELSGSFEDAPGAAVFNLRLNFRGNPQPDAPPAPATVHPLALLPPEPQGPSAQLVQMVQIPQSQSMAVAAGFGAAQDRDPADPGMRYYRVETRIPFSFAGRTDRSFQVSGRGQCHLQQVSQPGSNVSGFGPPARVRVFDPQPPALPVVEAPQWASLPDGNGVSRALLDWKAASGAAGYVVYDATETTLLAALGLPGPDPAQPFTQRLALLRNQDLSSLRTRFRRLEPGLIKDTHYEAVLPRGSAVIHFYAITAISPNQVESDWPVQAKDFLAVAAPRLSLPAAPALQASADPQTGAVHLLVEALGTIPTQSIQLYRTTNPKLAIGNVDEFGPPIGPPLNVNGGTVSFTDNTITPGWRRIWYRAVAWSAPDDLKGIVEGRSPASSPVSVMILPSAAPEVLDVLVNEPRSTAQESLVSWSSRAPLSATSFGSHIAIVEVRDIAGGVIRLRLEEPLDELAVVLERAGLPAADPDHRIIICVPDGSGYRLYTWIPRTEQTVHLAIKMIDPLGRMGSRSLDVPPLDPALATVTIPGWSTKKEVLEGDDMGMNVVSAEELGLQVVFEFDQQHPGFGHEDVISIDPSAGTVVFAGSTVTVLINLEG
jgi:hypothetical protein